MTRDVDVVVAGAGGAGTVAALAAAQAGATVALVEWRATFERGNNTSMSTAMIPAAGSRWQAAAGVVDSPARFAADMDAKTKGTVDPVVRDALTGVAPELVAWLADHVGVPLELVTDFLYPGHAAHRCHTVPDRSGRTLLQHLVEAVAATESIVLVVPRRVVGATPDPAGEDLVVETEPPAGERESLRAGALVLATGGFGANEELVARYVPEIAEATYFGGDGCMGDGLRIGESLGGLAALLDAYQGHGSLAVPQQVLTTWATVMLGGVLVNAEGRRFGDESSGYSEFASLVARQPGATAWVIFDERVDTACLRFADHQALHDAGAVRAAATVEELAEATSLPVDALTATLAEVAQASAGGPASTVDRFGRTNWAAPLAAPYRAVRVAGALFHTQGGLRVGPDAQVVGADGRPVPRLFAAGGAAVGASGSGAAGYLAGNGLLAALGLGLLAGRAAAHDALGA